ncbi:hypothetical protein L4A35_29790, partial [Salmonella enterica subsp. diarizonae serovar 16:z10:e,n,x,z15]|nr:hypothetical protein [Salmonella enterica subsp. diarizonae serovar 16:z10:e,n,x,z15]
DNISGDIVSFRDNICIFSTSYNSTIKIKSSDIENIKTNNIYTITLNNGDKITGNIKTNDNKKPTLTKENFIYSFNFEDVKNIVLHTKEKEQNKKQISKK